MADTRKKRLVMTRFNSLGTDLTKYCRYLYDDKSIEYLVDIDVRILADQNKVLCDRYEIYLLTVEVGNFANMYS